MVGGKAHSNSMQMHFKVVVTAMSNEVILLPFFGKVQGWAYQHFQVNNRQPGPRSSTNH